MRNLNLNRIVAVLRTLTPSQLAAVSAEVAALESQSAQRQLSKAGLPLVHLAPTVTASARTGTARPMVCSAIAAASACEHSTP